MILIDAVKTMSRGCRVRVRHHMAGSKLLGVGGSEYVALETVIGLVKHGYSACLDAIALAYVARSHKGIIHKMLGFYGIPLSEAELVDLCNEEEYDVTINMTGDFLSGFSHMIYFHFPSIAKPETYYVGLPLLMRSTSYIYYLINRVAMKGISRRAILLLANSVFTAKYIHRILGRKPEVLHPPVNIGDIIDKPVIPIEGRDKTILVVSRISYEKQPHKILYIAKILDKHRLRDWHVLLVGANTKFSDKIMGEILSIARRHGIENYIDIRTNVPREELIEYYRRAYMYVHLTEKEHFGISVIEAMSAGTPIIVPSTAGSWIDIAGMDDSVAVPYSCTVELEKAIMSLITNRDRWIELSRNARMRSRIFDRRRFHEEIAKYVNYVENSL